MEDKKTTYDELLVKIKNQEQKMNKAKRLYLFVSRINQLIVRIQDRKQLFQEVCDVAIEVGKFKMAWIGLINPETKEVLPVSVAGDHQDYLSIVKTISLSSKQKGGTGPAGIAMRTAKYKLCNAIEDDPIMEPWREEALKKGFLSVMALPIKMFDKVIGVFVIYAAEKNYFDDEEIQLLDNATSDVSFALEFFEKEKMRKRAEEAVAQSEKRFHTLTEVSPVGIYRTDLTGATTYVNQRWTQIVGINFEQSMGSGWYLAIHPDDQVKLFDEWKKVVKNREKSLLEYRFVKPDGTIVWVIGQATPETNAENQIIGFIGTITDITERKLAEDKFLSANKKLEAIIQAIPDMIFEIGLDSIIYNYHSQNTNSLLMPVEQFIGKKIPDVLPPNAAQTCLYALKEASEKGFSNGEQYTLEMPDGLHWYELSIAPMKEEANKESHFICISRDITEQHKMNEEIQKSKEQAEAANKYKTDFLANMSHEIRTPLNGIIGFTSLLMETKLEEKQQKYMSTINESAMTLMDIVNDILDFSKIEAGKLELKIEEVDLFALTNQIISLFKYQATQKQIDLILNIDASVPQFVFVDLLRLKQIVVNLLGNAIKFTQKGQIRLDIEALLPIEADYVHLSFSVKDTGIGINPKNRDKIFHSFVQEDNSTSRQFGGTGLGLAISNQLLELMDSKLQLESIPGEGSNFYFCITLKKSNFKIQHQSQSEKMTVAKPIPGSKKVLIVEDNKINMFLAKTLIQKIIPDCSILEAFDGEQAVEQYKIQQPDIILMDIQMPNKNGFEATYEIRKIEENSFTPIVALTAGIFIEEKEECLKSGMNDYITKPIIPSDLEIVLNKWLVG
ncbi:ATP-binding protein [Flavobacterium sp. GSA192]|uniref:ATP-binding protein n=1 Tax=Flavobacterium sp. GSA192 TaxID=2576304 RepID=UPI00112BCE5F|nr:ATP-binding protein [Flavobacterium sp. GSA192]